MIVCYLSSVKLTDGGAIQNLWGEESRAYEEVYKACAEYWEPYLDLQISYPEEDDIDVDSFDKLDMAILRILVDFKAELESDNTKAIVCAQKLETFLKFIEMKRFDNCAMPAIEVSVRPMQVQY